MISTKRVTLWTGGARERANLASQVEEIARAQLKAGEEEELRARKNILAHSEKLTLGCREGEDLLYEGDAALVGRLGKYAAKLRELAGIDANLQPTEELIQSSLAQLQEAAAQLRRYAERVHFDPRALEQLEDRLAEIQRLKRKYNASVDDILRMEGDIQQSLERLENSEEQIAAMEKTFAAARGSAWNSAEKLSNERRRSAKKLRRELEKEARGLGMAEVAFEARFLSQDEKADVPPFFIAGKRLTERGMDQVEFYFSSNPGEPVKPLAKIASGGELSRLMLALKSLVMTPGVVSTLLFDEVDSGVGGRVAEIVGKKLKQVAAQNQVISVTHLPQIAALADCHYVVQMRADSVDDRLGRLPGGGSRSECVQRSGRRYGFRSAPMTGRARRDRPAVIVDAGYIGGAGDDKGYGVAVDADAGNTYISGRTNSSRRSFPDATGLDRELQRGHGGRLRGKGEGGRDRPRLRRLHRRRRRRT